MSQDDTTDDDDLEAVDLGIKFAKGNNPLISPVAPSAARKKTKKRKSRSPNAPVTVSTPRKQSEKTVPTSPSKPNPCCDKNHRVDLTEWDGSYFTAAYQLGKSNIPTHCSGYCKRLKLVGDDVPMSKVDVRVCRKITKAKQAAICPNAQREDHPCVFAMCYQCKLMMDLVGSGEKKELVENGTWVVVDNDEKKKPVKRHRIRHNRTLLSPGEYLVGDRIVGYL